MAITSVSVPDIGGAENVDVIEILVAVGDTIAEEDSLITLETEKASMEVPSPVAGVVKSISVSVGDKINEGDVILEVETAATAGAAEPAPAQEAPAAAAKVIDVAIPDIGGAEDVDVIEVMVSEGDTLAVDDSLVTLETEKASMEVPSPHAGVVKSVTVAVGDKVSEGTVILSLETTEAVSAPAAPKASSAPSKPTTKPAASASSLAVNGEAVLAAPVAWDKVHAGPAVRRLARELGADLTRMRGTGAKGRILKTDVEQYVKTQLAKVQGGGGAGFGLPAAPVVDFAKFGEIETQALSKIKKLSGANLHRNWVLAPHVTQFEEADITEMDAFRKQQKAEAAKQGVKLTPLVFIMKAVVAALQAHPEFNASLDASGENLVLKKYFHLGIAVDTPNGLVVPVIRDVDQKGYFELAKELGDISAKAREKGLTPAEMSGGCFTISSLGGIAGTAFTPIINLPEVAILGVSKAAIKPVYQEGEFVPRMMLPLSLSYDHRVIDGAQGARFIKTLNDNLSDIRRLNL